MTADDALRAAWAAGETRASICTRLGISDTTLSRALRRLGLPPRQPQARRVPASAVLGEIHAAWLAGEAREDIRNRLGLTHSALTEACKTLGLKQRRARGLQPKTVACLDDVRIRVARGETAREIAAACGWSLAYLRTLTSEAGVSLLRSPSLEDAARMKVAWVAGTPIEAIARLYGYSVRQFHRIRRQFEFPAREAITRKNGWSKAQQTELRRMRAEGLTVMDIAVATGRVRNSVLGAIQRYCPRIGQRPAAPAVPKPHRVYVGARNGDAVFVSMPPTGPFESASAAEKLDGRVERAREAIRKGGAPNRVARSFSVPLRVAYQLAGEVRREREEA